MAVTLPFTALARCEVFAVDSTSAQIAWRRAGVGTLSALVADIETPLGDAARSGVGEINGLTPDTSHSVLLFVDGRPAGQLTVRTAPALAGSPILKIATISDLHLGETAFGLTRTMRDRSSGPNGYPLRCTLAAVRESLAWGAQLLVIKGDITDSGKPAHWDLFDRVLDEVDIPVMAVPGNHDTVGLSESIDHRRALESRGLDSADIQIRNSDGVRIVAVNSTVPGRGRGTMANRIQHLLTAVDTDEPALIFAHHHFESTPVPYFWPPGVRLGESRDILSQLASVNPNLLLSSGHTHRNRARRAESLLLTEVSSVKDHPGVWAGYEVHSSGIRQTTRRLMDPGCAAWNDRTHAAVAGIWGRWAPGSIEQRSITHLWPRSSRSQGTDWFESAEQPPTAAASAIQPR